ncbi:polysaccharide deacetylase family protein [Enemella dayhoffiae]|nr:polysaccharide deacetylase family protein [Enemella dayhoffiae]
MASFPGLRVGLSALVLVALAGCSGTGEQAMPAATPVPPPASTPAPTTVAPTTAAPTTPAPVTTPPQAAPSTATAKPGTPKPASPPPPAPPATPAPPPGPVQQPAPGAKVDCAKLKCIALTFDDGPSKDTPRLLEMLTREQVVATFFQQGVNIRANPAITKQVADTPGMELGDHSMSHPNLAGAGKDKLNREIGGTHALLKQTTGRDVTVFRPPYGARNAAVDSAAASVGESVILWDVDTMDWKTRSASATRDAVRKQAHPGAIVLMHDIHPSTVNAVPGIITDLKGQGYTLVTVSQLLGGTSPGKVYTTRG